MGSVEICLKSQRKTLWTHTAFMTFKYLGQLKTSTGNSSRKADTDINVLFAGY